MKSNPFVTEVIIAIILIAILVVCLNPFEIFMPPPFIKMLLVFLLVVFTIFASVVWKQRVEDERESLHRILAGHLAFLVGSTFLVVGITIQELNNTLDPWLVFTLVSMILAKLIGSAYSQKKN